MAPSVLWSALLLTSSLLGAVSAQADGNGTTPSGCQVCANSGDCAHAYRGEPGQFCGNWLDRANQRQPCCCPNNAVCKTSNYACNCAYSGAMPPYHGGDGAPADQPWFWWFLPVLLVALCCCGFMMFTRAEDRENDRLPMAAPGQSYGDAPVYASAPPAHGGYGRGRMGAGTGAALGGTAGLLGGLWLGETLAHAGHSGSGGGGSDFAGDF